MLPIPANAVNGNIESLVIPANDSRIAPGTGRSVTKAAPAFRSAQCGYGPLTAERGGNARQAMRRLRLTAYPYD